MSELTAVDVAILPEGDIVAELVRCNEALLAIEPSGFRFDASHLPHLTLLQQCVRTDRLRVFHERLATLLQMHRPLELELTHYRTGGTTAHLVAKPTTELRRLHEQLVEELADLAEPAVPATAFMADDEPVRDRDRAWVEGFRRNSSGEHFDPHITVGVGSASLGWSSRRFVAARVASCQLGRFCTCRTVLQEWRLIAPPA